MNIVKIYELFPASDDCISHIEKVRWGDTPTCPYCKSSNQTPLKSENKRYHCNNCNTSFSVTVGTIFHHTHLPLQKWFIAISLVINAKKGLSARQLGRDLNINKDTAWRMAMKIHEAMSQFEQRKLLVGIVEADETYVGGKPRKDGPKNGNEPGCKNKRGRGTKKTPVVGLVERGGNIATRSFHNKRLTSKNLKALVRENVDIKNSTLFTDEYKGYLGIKHMMPHKTIDHTIWYVDGDIHTNTVESFWALLKHGIVGQYHKVSLRYLSKYIDEFCYRWNHRKDEAADIFSLTLQRAVR